MDVQIDYFNITRRQMDGLLGKAKARRFLWKKAIFSITIGSNDFLNNYLLPFFSVGERLIESPDDFVNHLITSLRSQLIVISSNTWSSLPSHTTHPNPSLSVNTPWQRLYSLDARKIVVSNVGPVGCIPYQKTINRVKENECVSLPNLLAVRYNAQLRDLLAELNDNLPGARFVLANVYDLVMELITNHRSYGKHRFGFGWNHPRCGVGWIVVTPPPPDCAGFKTASYACCGNGGQYQGIIPCGPLSSMCEDRAGYVFWDPYHPSEAANLFLAKYIVDGDSKYISPMNLRRLLQL
ncbi:hypothetical protein BHM03_00012264 [Ensete ventricosum]|nr:hypothetical protein BHM03_00012264 [Ensete ventricosum]